MSYMTPHPTPQKKTYPIDSRYQKIDLMIIMS